jgi:hypothetical protein
LTEIDLGKLRAAATHKDRYQQQLKRLAALKKQTSCIEAAVSKASENIKAGTRSFIIYGEPQSGKTEMMICLTAKLVDAGSRIVIHLLNDSVQLLQQNLDRFQRSSLSPAAKNFSDVLDPDISLRTGDHIIFCKKNASDLTKLINKTRNIHSKVIIDDEADFATPNALVNKGEVTRINHLIGELIGSDGIYIGVTATPARLDLNNTFDNDNEQWVNFPPHDAYTGQDVFFPIDSPVEYSLMPLPDSEDIQRARMFGSRRTHLSYFELTIPETLYVDWHRCFVFHKLALEAIKAKMGSPVWLADQRIAVAASSSIANLARAGLPARAHREDRLHRTCADRTPRRTIRQGDRKSRGAEVEGIFGERLRPVGASLPCQPRHCPRAFCPATPPAVSSPRDKLLGIFLEKVYRYI